MFLAGLCIIGALLGVMVEYWIHRILHIFSVKLHNDHHKDFFHMEPSAVAKRSHPLAEYSLYALIVLIVLSPLILLLGWVGYFCLYGGIFFHLMVVYQVSHFTLHDDSWMPAFIRSWSWYKWWRDCHTEHHWHIPRKNLCVTCPFVDMLFGTYVKPRGTYRKTPVRSKDK